MYMPNTSITTPKSANQNGCDYSKTINENRSDRMASPNWRHDAIVTEPIREGKGVIGVIGVTGVIEVIEVSGVIG